MQNLFPIIRRKRRPLVVADTPPVAVGNVAPGSSVATEPVQPAVLETEPENSDAQVPFEQESR